MCQCNVAYVAPLITCTNAYANVHTYVTNALSWPKRMFINTTSMTIVSIVVSIHV
jgi:hypothetical protein